MEFLSSQEPLKIFSRLPNEASLAQLETTLEMLDLYNTLIEKDPANLSLKSIDTTFIQQLKARCAMQLDVLRLLSLHQPKRQNCIEKVSPSPNESQANLTYETLAQLSTTFSTPEQTTPNDSLQSFTQALSDSNTQMVTEQRDLARDLLGKGLVSTVLGDYKRQAAARIEVLQVQRMALKALQQSPNNREIQAIVMRLCGIKPGDSIIDAHENIDHTLTALEHSLHTQMQFFKACGKMQQKKSGKKLEALQWDARRASDNEEPTTSNKTHDSSLVTPPPVPTETENTALEMLNRLQRPSRVTRFVLWVTRFAKAILALPSFSKVTSIQGENTTSTRATEEEKTTLSQSRDSRADLLSRKGLFGSPPPSTSRALSSLINNLSCFIAPKRDPHLNMRGEKSP